MEAEGGGNSSCRKENKSLINKIEIDNLIHKRV